MSAQSRVTSRCAVAHSGREYLNHYLPILMRGMLPLFSIVTLCTQWLLLYEGDIPFCNKIAFLN